MTKKAFIFLCVLFATTVPALAQERGYIGVRIADQADRGVLVRTVEGNSPAEKAGMKADDVIVRYDKQDVRSVLQLTRLVSETPVGRTVDVTIERDKREQTLKVTSEAAPSPIGRFGMRLPDMPALRDRKAEIVPRFDALPGVSLTQTGIRVDSLTPQLRDFFGVKGGQGVLVSSVDAQSAAGSAGLKAGDVIVAFDGRSVSSPADFAREMRSHGGPFTLRVVREKQEREIRVEK